MIADAGFVDLTLGPRFDMLRGAGGEEQARPFVPSGLVLRCSKPPRRDTDGLEGAAG